MENNSDKIIDLGIVVGSLRKESYTLKTAKWISGLFPGDIKIRFIDISTLPLYNQDLDVDKDADADLAVPTAWRELRKIVKSCEAFLFVTPEYNRSIPAALKNALDVASRPMTESGWRGKKAGVIGVSPGAFGAILCTYQLRQTLAFLGIDVIPKEMVVGEVAGILDADGNVINEHKQSSLQKYIDSLVAYIRNE